MVDFKCPRCTEWNYGIPTLLSISGFARCNHCGIGIEWESKFFKRSLNTTDTYIPEGCSKSPKTGKITCSHRAYKAPLIVPRIISALIPIVGNKYIEKRRRFEGTLK